MARKVGQIVRRGPRTWLVRVYILQLSSWASGRACEPLVLLGQS